MLLSLEHPAEWRAIDAESGSEHFSGDDGFFRLSAIASGGMTLNELARAETEHVLQPFGSSPVVDIWQVGGGEMRIDARKITPSADQPMMGPNQPAWGEVILEFPSPLLVNGFLADFLLLQADLDHLDAITATLKFDEQALKQSLYSVDAETPAAGICASYEQPVVPVVISAETMPDPRCIQVQPGQVLNLVNQAGIEVPLNFGNYELSLQPGEERFLNVPVGKYLAPGVHHLELGVFGSAPEIWLVPAPQTNLADQPVEQDGIIQGMPVFSPDGSMLATPTSLGVDLYDAGSLALLRCLPVETGSEFVAFSPDGNRLASGAGWHVQLWGNNQTTNVDGWTLLSEMTGSTSSPESRLVDLGFSPEGELLATGFRSQGEVIDGAILIWNAQDGSFFNSLLGMTFDFSPVHKRLVAVWQETGGSYIYSYSFSGSPTDIFQGERAFFLPDGILVAEKNNSVRLIDMNSGKTLYNFNGQPVGFSGDGSFLVLLNQGILRIYNTKDGTIATTLEGSWEQVSQLLFSPNGRFAMGVAYGCPFAEGACEAGESVDLVWRLSDGVLVQTISGDDYSTWMVFYPDIPMLLSARPGGLERLHLVEEY